MRTHRYLAPEVVQTSAMDCGPASLKCLLEGFGTQVSYGRLREACQTEIDGTSIDTLEEVANRLGLDAAQIMVPVDHLLLPEAQVLPALVVIRQPNGMTHFVVVWRRHGPFVQVMDPAEGRRWMRADRFLSDVYLHTQPVPADAWRAWAASEGFLDPLTARLQRLRLQPSTIKTFTKEAQQDTGWHTFAALDAATRMVTALVQAGSLRRGPQAHRLLRTLLDRVVSENKAEVIPETYWSVQPAAPDAEGNDQVSMRGAVLVRVSKPQAQAKPQTSTLPPELQAALDEKPARPGRDLWKLMRADGLLTPVVLTLTLLLAAAGVMVEALLFRGLFDLGQTLAPMQQRLGAVLLLLAFLTALLLLEWPIFAGMLRMGRRLEVRLRIAFLEKIPRLSDRYFQSRPVSDMAERSHSIHRLRQLPVLGSGLLRTGFGLLLTTAGLIWLDPATAPLALAATGFALAWPLLTKPVLAERDLRVQTHTGALGRFYLDAMLGLVAIRTHGAERAVRREQEALLVEWARAGLRLQKALVSIEGIQQIIGFGLAAWILYRHIGQGELGTVLLLVYWALNIPVLGQEFAQHIRQYPTLRNKTLRLLEPLGALEEAPFVNRAPETATPSLAPSLPKGVALTFEGVQVSAGGHIILNGIDLHIPAGQHVAIVGRSGAGKSSLAGLLLGWHRAAAGSTLIDGEPLDGATLETLRRQTAWVDPAVQLWNAPLLDNLMYAAGTSSNEAKSPLSKVLQQAHLQNVLQKLPAGLQTALGEGGARLSGGEGQRVRFGRALMQSDARLVILDEPFRGLDHKQRRSLLAEARQHWQHATLLCITHDILDTQDFERVLVIEEGCVVEDDAPEILLKNTSRYRALREQEQKIRYQMWTDAGWRRLCLTDGVLTEKTEPSPKTPHIHLFESHHADEHAPSIHLADLATG